MSTVILRSDHAPAQRLAEFRVSFGDAHYRCELLTEAVGSDQLRLTPEAGYQLQQGLYHALHTFHNHVHELATDNVDLRTKLLDLAANHPHLRAEINAAMRKRA